MNRIGDNLICTGNNKEIVQSLYENEVEFILVGGLAISWYCQSRQADDMDLLVNPTVDNSQKISQALLNLNLKSIDQNCFASTGVQLPIKDKSYYAEILTPTETGPCFSDLMKDSIIGKLFNISINIPSIENLIKLKENAVESTKQELDKHINDLYLLRKMYNKPINAGAT